MKYEAVFFDLDDTLIDTKKNSLEALGEIYTELKLGNYISDIDNFISKYQIINNELWELYEQGKIDKKTLKTQRFYQSLSDYIQLSESDALDINNRFMQLVSSKSNLIEYSIDILNYLNQTYDLYILSNGFDEIQQRKMISSNIHLYFKAIILSDHIGKNKPDPEIFNYALSIAKCKPNDCIMIGDNIKTDIMGAKNSNIDQIWYNKHNLKDKFNIRPNYIIQNLIELKLIL